MDGLFKFDDGVSEEARRLARKFFQFVTVVEQIKLSCDNSLLQRWSAEFDRFLKEKSFDDINNVLGHYMSHWNKEECYVHTSPKTFIDYFPVYEKMYIKTVSPIPVDELKPLLRRLSRYVWKCAEDLLVASVGRSLWNLRRFYDAFDSASLSDRKKNYVRMRFGDSYDYIKKHYVSRSKGMTIHKLEPPLTISGMCRDMENMLQGYGCSSSEIKSYVSEIKKLAGV